MSDFKFEVAVEIFDQLPEASFGGLLLRGLTPKSETPNNIEFLTANVAEDIVSRGKSILTDPELGKWETFFAHNKDKAKASHVSLIERILKDKKLPRINTLVDIYNSISVHYKIPVGGHDVSNTSAVTVIITNGKENFQAMNQGETVNVMPEEIAYIDDKQNILTRHFVWRQSESSKTSDSTKDLFIPLDNAFNLLSDKAIERIIQELLAIINQYYEFEFNFGIINKYNPELIFRQFKSSQESVFELPKIAKDRGEVNTNLEDVEKFFDRKLDLIYPSNEALKQALLSGKRLKFYIGADATGPRLHLGHVIPVKKMGYLQKLGHQIIFLVGDFTARLGDPTDKSIVRKMLSDEEVDANAAKFKNQIARYIDFDCDVNPAEVTFNSHWNSDMTFGDVIKLASNFTVQQMLERDMFQKRIEEQKPIYLHEFIYPLIQGYDTVAMQVHGEFGGRDQTFNMLAGRTLAKTYRDIDKFVVTTHFLLAADGKNKMSKSIGNCIFIEDSPQDKFAKVMAIPDSLIPHFYEMATEVDDEFIQNIKAELEQTTDPLALKKQLAHRIVSENHNQSEADKALAYFERTIQNNEVPLDAKQINKADLAENITLKDLLQACNTGLSNSDLKRLVRDSAVEVNGEAKTDLMQELTTKDIEYLKIGKKIWVKIT